MPVPLELRAQLGLVEDWCCLQLQVGVGEFAVLTVVAACQAKHWDSSRLGHKLLAVCLLSATRLAFPVFAHAHAAQQLAGLNRHGVRGYTPTKAECLS